ncbi:MAG TPA: sedoheptulose 7-phosphate cyclase [Amycolatopsis sp.]|nr:sedoheptulose 7-phosphate cyclase [Amycolatopsis sp.]
MAGLPEPRNPSWAHGDWTVATERKVSYRVTLLERLLDHDNSALMTAAVPPGDPVNRALIVADSTVEARYGAEIRSYFAHHDMPCEMFALPVSEPGKTIERVTAVVDAFDEFRVARGETVVAFGGGVLLDVVGLAASLYRRGTAHVRVPTTLVGLVDAGIGAKTGVNHGDGKSRLGAYHPPREVLLDRTFLRTLDRRHITNGVAEILKMAIVADERLFRLLEEHGPALVEERFQGNTPTSDGAAGEVLARAISGMLTELAGNLWEHQLERIVDYGHSVSPLIEMLALPELLHGEAVAIDMALFAVLSARRGLLAAADRDRILAVLRGLGLPVSHPLLEISVLSRALAETTRHRGGRQRLPIPVKIGAARMFSDVSDDELALAAKELGSENAG